MDEAVDGIGGGTEGGWGWGDGGGRLEGPVFLVNCAFLDPATEERALGVVEGLVGIRRRHDVVGIGGGDAAPEFTGIGVTGFEGDTTILAGSEGAFGGIESQTGLAMFGVEAVAGEAMVGEDGSDVAVELERGGGEAGGAQGETGDGRDQEMEERAGETHRRGESQGLAAVQSPGWRIGGRMANGEWRMANGE